MRAARVLVVDDDPWILRMVKATLEKRNYVVDTARDGKEALQRIQATAPDVIITDVMMPVMDGWALAQQLRATPHWAHIPVIFLTALGKDEGRLQSLGIEPAQYLSKPFRFDDLEQRVIQALSGHTGMPAQPGAPSAHPGAGGFGQPGSPPWPGMSTPHQAPAAPEPGNFPAGPPPAAPPQPHPSETTLSRLRNAALNGRLEQLGLSSLLVMMEMERKDGVLTLKGDDEGTGRIFIRKGQVIHAKLESNTEIQGKESVYEMLRWQSGTFSFSAMEVDMEDTIQSSTTHLLMEGARLIDEANRDSF